MVHTGITRTLLAGFTVVLILADSPVEAHPRPPIKAGTRVIVLSKEAMLRVEDRQPVPIAIGTVFTVKQTNGKWVWYRDSGSESRSGWIWEWDVIPLSDVAEYATAQIPRNPDEWSLFFCRGRARELSGQLDLALIDLTMCLRLRSRDPQLYIARANVWQKKRETRAMLADLKQASRLDPSDPMTMDRIAWTLATHADATVRNGRLAVEYARRSCDVTDYNNWFYLETLAAAFAESGQFEPAVLFAKRVAAMAPDDEVEDCRERLALYQQGQPYRQSTASTKVSGTSGVSRAESPMPVSDPVIRKFEPFPGMMKRASTMTDRQIMSCRPVLPALAGMFLLAAMSVAAQAQTIQVVRKPPFRQPGSGEFIAYNDWSVSYSRVQAPGIFELGSFHRSLASAQAAAQRLIAWSNTIKGDLKLAVILIEGDASIVKSGAGDPQSLFPGQFGRSKPGNGRSRRSREADTARRVSDGQRETNSGGAGTDSGNAADGGKGRSLRRKYSRGIREGCRDLL